MKKEERIEEAINALADIDNSPIVKFNDQEITMNKLLNLLRENQNKLKKMTKSKFRFKLYYQGSSFSIIVEKKVFFVFYKEIVAKYLYKNNSEENIPLFDSFEKAFESIKYCEASENFVKATSKTYT